MECVAKSARGTFAALPAVERLLFDSFSLGAVGRLLPDTTFADFMCVATYGSDRMKASGRPSEELPPDGRDARERWIGVFAECIRRERAKPRPAATDLLAVVLRNGTTLDDRDLAAELGNIFYGGDFSGPSTLVTVLYLLTQHPDEVDRLRVALAASDGGCAAVLGCVALDQVLRESMRLLPAVPLWGRRVLADQPTTLGRWELPANTKIFLTNWMLHRSGDAWGDGEAFRPARWTPDLVAQHPYAGSGRFFPLGLGPRTCLGGHYIVYLLKLILAQLLGSFEVSCGAGQAYDDGQTFFFGTRLPAGIRATVKDRR